MGSYFFSRYNSRKIQPNEVIFDLETKDKNILDAFRFILKNAGYSFTIWDTGSRGYHIHLQFNEFRTMDTNQRKKLKIAFMRMIVNIIETNGNFEINKNKLVDYGKTDNQQILIEYSRHRKTGNYKLPVEERDTGYKNRLPKVIIN